MCQARKIFSIRKFLAFDLQLFQAMQSLESGTGQLRPVQVETAELRQAGQALHRFIPRICPPHRVQLEDMRRTISLN